MLVGLSFVPIPLLAVSVRLPTAPRHVETLRDILLVTSDHTKRLLHLKQSGLGRFPWTFSLSCPLPLGVIGRRYRTGKCQMLQTLGRRSAWALCIAAATYVFPDASANAQDLDAVRKYRAANEKQILEQFIELLSLPNVATNVNDIDRKANVLVHLLQSRGLDARSLSPGPGRPPSVFAQLLERDARRTVLFYAHFDGQPVTQPDWISKPFSPVLRSGGALVQSKILDWKTAQRLDSTARVYARSASDDMGTVQAILSALDALKSSGQRPNVNVKIFLDGEEEQGSPNLPSILSANRELLKSDLVILGDGPVHQSGMMQVFFGARGFSTLELTVFGPTRPLHDGTYGNWAPNPAARLVNLLASMRDQKGQILIPGMTDGVRRLSDAEQAALANLPDVETQLLRELRLSGSESGERIGESVSRPSLNIRGLKAGNVGADATNTIQTRAQASIDFRLVPDQRPEQIKEAVESFIRAQGWYVVAEEPDSTTRLSHQSIVMTKWSPGYGAYRADVDMPAARAILTALDRARPPRVVRLPMLGASVPMKLFADALGAPVVGVPIANYDNNQHAANENLRLKNLWDGIDVYASLMTGLSW